MMTGFRLVYVAATICVGIAAVSRTGTFLLLRTLVDDVLDKTRFELLPLVALGFVGLAVLEGAFTFLGGRWAAQTAEGITRRLRNYLFDHIQRLSFTYHDHTPTGDLIQRSTSDVDAVRRFFADQAINSWRIVLLFVDQPGRADEPELAAGVCSPSSSCPLSSSSRSGSSSASRMSMKATRNRKRRFRRRCRKT